MSDERAVPRAFTVGERREMTRTVTPRDVAAFADLTGDRNPVHLDPAFAATTRFGRPIAHGMLVASLFSGIMGQQLPGPGTIYLGQKLRFLAPVFVGAEVTVSVEIIEIKEKGRATLRTLASSDGKVVIDGDAEVLLPKT